MIYRTINVVALNMPHGFTPYGFKKCEGYALKIWNENNIHELGIPQTIRQFPPKNVIDCVLLANYLRFKILLKGGWYIDTDVDILKNPDCVAQATTDLLLGFHCDNDLNGCIDTAIMYAQPDHPFIQERVTEIERNGLCAHDCVWDPVTNVTNKIRAIHDLNLKNINYIDFDKRRTITILPKEYFYPYTWNEPVGGITTNTVMIHKWEKSWWPKE